MTRDEVVAVLRRRLGNRSTSINDAVIEELKLAQTRLEQVPVANATVLAELPWFLITEEASSATVADEERVEIPSDFIMELEAGAMWLQENSTWNEIFKGDLDSLRATDLANITDQRYYALVGGYFRFFPTPDDVYPVKMLYYKYDDVLSTNIENQWLKYVPELMIAEAGIKLAQFIQNDKKVVEFTNDRMVEVARLNKANAARKHANRSYQMGKL
jgi:hypothetical protein